METALSEEQVLLRDAVRELLDKEFDPVRRRELERTGEIDRVLWGKLAELGWLGLPFPASLGGEGGTLVDLAIVVEELARHAAFVPYAEVMAGAVTLLRHGNAAVAQDELAAIIAGRSILLPAMLDSADSFDGLAEKGGARGRLSGKRLFVDYGPFATRYLVRIAAAGGDELRLVDAARDHVRCRPLRTIARVPSAVVEFDDAPARNGTGPEGYAFLLLLARTLTAVQCLGNAQAALDMTVEYVRNRVQFGRPIGAFQAVQHHCANMALMTEATRFLVYEAIWALDDGSATAEQVAMAKAWASRSAVEVTALAHQLHGGIGVTEEYDLHFFSLCAKERALAWGTAGECLRLVAATIERPVEWA